MLINDEILGEPLNVRQAAKLIGCSVWSIRQRLIPKQGLPCMRFGSSGKLVFYRGQLIRWILNQQKQTKGGTER